MLSILRRWFGQKTKAPEVGMNRKARRDLKHRKARPNKRRGV